MLRVMMIGIRGGDVVHGLAWINMEMHCMGV